MATEVIELSTTVWTRLTDAGQSGTAWKKTGGPVVIDHTDQEGGDTVALTSVNITKDKSKRVPLDKDSDDVLILPADNSLDVFYAISLEGAAEKLAVDVV